MGNRMGAKEIVSLEHVWVYYGETAVLEDVDFSIKSDDFIGIIGPNGSGKTTLLKVILGLVTPTFGKVRVFGKSPMKGHGLVGYVPQYNLFDRDFPVNVQDVVLMGRYSNRGLLKRYAEEDGKAARRALEAVGMYEHRYRRVGRLSGGEQQRVFIARALVSDPKLLLLDEPTASVDVTAQTEFYELLVDLKEKMAIVLVSHDMVAISSYVEEIACMNKKLFYHGSKEISPEDLERTYQCPINLIMHGQVPHRVLKEHR